MRIRDLALLLALTSLASCGSLTHHLWSHGEGKHWCVENRESVADVTAARFTPERVELVLATTDDALEQGWRSIAQEHEQDSGNALVLRAGAGATFLAGVLASPGSAAPATARLIVVHARSQERTATTKAILAAHGSLSLFEVVRPLDRPMPNSADPRVLAECRTAVDRVRALDLTVWANEPKASTAEPSLLSVRTEDPGRADPVASLQDRLERRDLIALREFWLTIGWPASNPKTLLEVRGDVLEFASSARCRRGNGIVLWDASAEFAPRLQPCDGTSRPSSTALPDRTVTVSFQRKELVGRHGLSAPVRVLLTPLTVAVDVATLGAIALVCTAFGIDPDDGDERPETVTDSWIWNPRKRRWEHRIELERGR